MALSANLQPKQEQQEREGNDQECIGMPRLLEISMKKRMYHSLAATTHALESGDTMENALRHPTIFQWVENKIE